MLVRKSFLIIGLLFRGARSPFFTGGGAPPSPRICSSAARCGRRRLPAILWHPAQMRTAPLALLVLAAATCTGCFQMTTVMKVNADGSGTVEHRMLFTTQALAQLRQFAALGGRGQAVDPTSEQQAREMTTALGPGVTYVSSTPVKTPTGEGRDAGYAFTDLGRPRVATHPAAPGGISIKPAAVA